MNKANKNYFMNTHKGPLLIDYFAGGGGGSLGMEQAWGRPVDIAINHNPEAIIMHKANHPTTKHYQEDVFKRHPLAITQGRRVAHAHFSPDCTHHSKAKGGTPVSNKRRGLAWIVRDVATWCRPDLITLENVPEFENWGPLCPMLDAAGNVKRDKNNEIMMVPDPYRAGEIFYEWGNQLKRLGYDLDWRVLKCCDYGAPTIRERLFLVARCDGVPIEWAEPTHGPGRKPYRTAAECIDWSIPCHSIFLTPDQVKEQKLNIRRPLKPNTLKRIARGVQRFVIDSPDPFFISYYGPKGENHFRGFRLGDQVPTQTTENRFGFIAPYIVPLTHHGKRESHDIQEPVKTITCANRSELGLIAPYIVPIANYNGDVTAHNVDEPLRTVTANPKGGAFSVVIPHVSRQFGQGIGSKCDAPIGSITAGGMGKAALVETFLVTHNSRSGAGRSVEKPAASITCKEKHAVTLVSSHLVELRGSNKDGRPVKMPVAAVMAGGQHVGEVRAFLTQYNSLNIGQDLKSPAISITTRDRLGLVTVHGLQYQIVDICMRMLSPRELFRAQDFPDTYVIDPKYRQRDKQTGKYKIKTLSKTAQVNMCGNSVPPGTLKSVILANIPVEVSNRMAV